VVQFVEALRYKPEGLLFDSRWCHYGPGVDSTSNRNQYQEYVLGPLLRADNLTNVMCRMSKSWEAHSPGTLRACPVLCSDCFTFTLADRSHRLSWKVSFEKFSGKYCRVLTGFFGVSKGRNASVFTVNKSLFLYSLTLKVIVVLSSDLSRCVTWWNAQTKIFFVARESNPSLSSPRRSVVQITLFLLLGCREWIVSRSRNSFTPPTV